MAKNDDDDFEDLEDEELEDDMDEAEEEVVKEQAVSKGRGRPKKIIKTTEDQPVENEIYVPIHQPERLAIMNTVTNQVEVEGFQDVGTAAAFNKIFNILERQNAAMGI